MTANGADEMKAKSRPPLQSLGSLDESLSLAYVLLDMVFTVVTFLLVVVILPFLLPISLIFRIYRHQLIRMVKEREGDSVMIMTGDDAIWMQDSRENRAVINSMLIMEGKPDIQLFTKLINERLVEAKDEESTSGGKLFPKATMYSNKLLHRYVWMEELQFDVSEHVYIYPTKVSGSRQELETLVSDICSQPLPSCKSPWQFILVESSEPDSNTFYVVFRVHHSIADGISLVRMLMSRMVDQVPEEASKRRFGSSSKLKKILKGIFYGPSMLIKRLGWPADNTVLHGQALSGQKLVSWSDRIDLNLIKKMKNMTGTTVNDVLMACLAGSFREYLRQHESNLPSDISAYIPVDIRPPKGKLVLDNQFALVFLHLPVDTDNGLDILSKTKRRMDQIKSSPEPLVNAMLIKYSMSRLPNWFTTMAFNWFSRKCSMVLSNVPGPQHHLTMGGQVITDLMFWPPQRANVALGVSIFSYAGHVRIGIMADKAILTNPDLLVQEFVKKVYSLASELKVD